MAYDPKPRPPPAVTFHYALPGGRAALVRQQGFRAEGWIFNAGAWSKADPDLIRELGQEAPLGQFRALFVGAPSLPGIYQRDGDRVPASPLAHAKWGRR